MNTLPANIQTALTERNIDTAVWTTLQNSVFPGAKDESILLAVDYCKARKLDILKKPCHIVPMSVTDAKQAIKTGVMSLCQVFTSSALQHFALVKWLVKMSQFLAIRLHSEV